jgi:hypothetical protein
MDILTMLDTDRYPVDRLDGPAGRALIGELQDDLASCGAASLPGFVRPEALEAMVAEAEELAVLGYRGPTEVSPYFFDYDVAAGHDEGHPTRFRGERNLAQVAYDLIPRNSLLCRLYHSDLITRMVAQVQDKAELYRLADPYQSLNISVMGEGGCQQWHFDRGKLVTTLLLQAADRGGVFEYVPRIRSDECENFDRVQQVLNGERESVRQIHIEPGMLNLFEGHYSMHRVTPVVGARHRLQTILAFADGPNAHGSEKSSELHYGRRPRLEATE